MLSGMNPVREALAWTPAHRVATTGTVYLLWLDMMFLSGVDVWEHHCAERKALVNRHCRDKRDG